MSRVEERAPATFKETVAMESTLAVTGISTFTGAIKPGSGGLWRSTPVVLAAADEATALTEAANAGRVNVIPDVAGNSKVFTLPTPSAAGVYYNFIYGGAAADAHTWHIKTTTTDGSVYFKGALAHHDTNQTGQTTSIVYSDGDSNDAIELAIAQAFDIHLLSLSTTVWYMWGWTAGNTLVTLDDS